MTSPCSPTGLQEFLVAAKGATYAAAGDEASVSALVPGTKQLEYRAGDFFYRDIYAGFLVFAGQEIVYFRDSPVWSMSYAGGTLSGADMDEARKVYALLRSALRRLPKEQPFRGPSRLDDEAYRYTNASNGDLGRFHGVERIACGETLVYELHYSGGLLA